MAISDYYAEQRRLIELKEKYERQPADYLAKLVEQLRRWPRTADGKDEFLPEVAGMFMLQAADALEALERINHEHVMDAQDAEI